jgi:prepilin-type processing-associated H-X9-DG protein
MYVLVRAKPLTAEELARRNEAIVKLRMGAARVQSINNLKMIGLAMHGYAAENKFLPMHAIYSKDGKTPLLSWRVAILPYIEQLNLYNEFKLDEPWDSAHNKKLIPRMPKFYDCPAAPEKIGKEGKTFYQVFTGPDTVFPGNQKMTFMEIKDDTSNTILAIEAKNPVIWTRPEDLTLPREKDKMPAVGGLFKNGITVLFCDGHVQLIRSDPPPAMFRAIVTPSGGEVVDFEKLEPKAK